MTIDSVTALSRLGQECQRSKLTELIKLLLFALYFIYTQNGMSVSYLLCRILNEFFLFVLNIPYIIFLFYLLGLFFFKLHSITSLSVCDFFSKCFFFVENYEMFPKPTTFFYHSILLIIGWYSEPCTLY